MVDMVIESNHHDKIFMDLLLYDQLISEQKAVMVIFLALQYFRCQNGTDPEGWFKVSYAEFKQKLGGSSDTITYCIRRLVDGSILERTQTKHNENYYRFTERSYEKIRYIRLRPQVVEKLMALSKSAIRLYLALHFFRIEQNIEGTSPILVKREDFIMFVGLSNNTITSSREALFSHGLIDFERSQSGKAPMFYYILEE